MYGILMSDEKEKKLHQLALMEWETLDDIYKEKWYEDFEDFEEEFFHKMVRKG